MVAGDSLKAKMIEDPMVLAYYKYFAKDNYLLIREYVNQKYRLGREEQRLEAKMVLKEEDREIGRTRRAFLEDVITFNNPKREEWEKSSLILSYLNLKSGETIADIGCGSGYFSYRFSKLVGPQGMVYAIDTKPQHIEFINDFTKVNHIDNIAAITSKIDDICLDKKVDYAFMCSLYHIIYGVSSEPQRAALMASITKSLKPGGRFVIIDNGPVSDEQLPYHGPYITKELIIYQLAFYGFTLESYRQIIPQRYMLVFRWNGDKSTNSGISGKQ
jgi:predicted methyltransferase